MEWSVPVYAGVSLVPSSPHLSLVLEDSHEIRGLLLRARASDYRFALVFPGTAQRPQQLVVADGVELEGDDHGSTTSAMRGNGYQ